MQNHTELFSNSVTNSTSRSFKMALNESNLTFGNDHYEPKEWPLIKHEEFTIVLLCFVYGLIFVTALIGNCLVICVVCKNPGMRNVTNVFIVNLAVADILVTLFCTPLTLMDNIYTGKLSFWYL